MGQKPINEWWDELHPETQQWLVDNPGCVILPRTVVNAISSATGGSVSQNQHGQCLLSDSDHAFIRAKAQSPQP